MLKKGFNNQIAAAMLQAVIIATKKTSVDDEQLQEIVKTSKKLGSLMYGNL